MRTFINKRLRFSIVLAALILVSMVSQAQSTQNYYPTTGNIFWGSPGGTATRPLHMKINNNPAIFLDIASSSSGTGKLELGCAGNSLFEIALPIFPGPGSGITKMGTPTAGKRNIYFNGGNDAIAFSSNNLFGAVNMQTNATGISGSYLFDGQIGTSSLMVSAAAPAPYATIPSGYIFNVNGNSNLNGINQINNTTDATPVNTLAGFSFSNTTSTVAGSKIPCSWIQTQESRPLALNPVPNGNPTTTNTSYVAVGFIPGSLNVPIGYKLAVKGKIICEELKVKYSGQWSDYVFDNSYCLEKLEDVEQHILTNKHLPGVPSAAEVEKEGYEAGTMDATLLKKIEELTLYVIDMNKKITALEKENEILKTSLQNK